jgi:hypothetical protein
MGSPDLLATLGVGKWEVDEKSYVPGERLIDIFLEVRGEDRHTSVTFHLLQEIARLYVGIAIMRVRDFCPLTE